MKTKCRQVKVEVRSSDGCGSALVIVLPWLVVSPLCQASVIYGFVGDSWATECTLKYYLGERETERERERLEVYRGYVLRKLRQAVKEKRENRKTSGGGGRGQVWE